MDLKPAQGVKVKVNAQREALFGDEAVAVAKVQIPDGRSRNGILTGATLAGYCEVEMPALDGKKHWYPVDSLTGESGEKIVEEEIVLDEDEDDSDE